MGLAGLAAVDEPVLQLAMVPAFDAGIGHSNQRKRGLTGVRCLVGKAIGQLAGQDCLAGLDRIREDAGSALLERVAVST